MPVRADKSNHPTRTKKHYSEQQKEMIEYYLKGVDDRNKRYTAPLTVKIKCSKKLGEGNKLKANQIKSFVSRYHR